MKKTLFLAFITIIICLSSINAHAVFRIHPKINDAFSVPTCVPLGDVLSSTAADLDATCINSYSGTGQTWANIETTPADSAAQTDYDFTLGAGTGISADDPTFSGTAGDSAAFFSLDGDDFFEDVDITGTSLSLSGMTSGTDTGPVWVAVAFKLGAVDTNIAFWGGNTGDAGMLRVLMNNTENMRFFQDGGVSGDFNAVIIPNDTFDASTDFLVIITYDTTSAGSERRWVNTTTGSDWDITYAPKTNTIEQSSNFNIGAGGRVFELPNNSKIYGFYSGNTILSDANAATIFTHLEARHDRDYTP